MTNEEAIKELNIAKQHLVNAGHLHRCTDIAFQMAIKALKNHDRPISNDEFIYSVYKELYD